MCSNLTNVHMEIFSCFHVHKIKSKLLHLSFFILCSFLRCSKCSHGGFVKLSLMIFHDFSLNTQTSVPLLSSVKKFGLPKKCCNYLKI